MIQPVPTPGDIIAFPVKSSDEVLEHVSASSIKDYLGCSLRFYFKRVLGLPEPSSPNLHLGKCVHAGIQAFHLARWRGGDSSTGAVIEQYRLAFASLEDADDVRYEDGERDKSLEKGEQAHALTHDGQRYFGLIEIQANNGYSDYRWILGIRNSHDKRLPAGLVAGTQVLVCSNLAFHGTIKLSRKHTRFILRDLPDMAREAVGGVQSAWNAQDHRIEAYKQARIRDRSAHDLVIRAVDQGVIANRLVPGVLKEWREPSHDAFRPRTVWSLHNAFTEAMKGIGLERLPSCTGRLTQLLDGHVGVN